MRHEHSKSYNKQFVQTAVHLNSYSTLCLMTAALLCCYSKPSERAAPRSARSEIYATLRYHVSYHTSTFELYTYTYAREFEPG